MTAFQQGYQDALAGRKANQFALRATDQEEYCTGYRQGTHKIDLEQGIKIGQATVEIEIPEKDNRIPRTDIILHVDAGSYLRHYDEQEGDIKDLAVLLKHDALKAIAEMDLQLFAADLVIDRGSHDVITSIVLKDRYEEIENGEENESGIEEVAEAEQYPQAI